MYNKYKSYIKEELFLRPYSIHGISHTKRVLRLAAEIAKHYNLSEQEEKILFLSCCYHDIGRTNDLMDDNHGKCGAEKLIKLHLLDDEDLSDIDKEIILDLITMHSVDDENFIGSDREILLYQILKDADALDRTRFGNNDLDPKYLRLEESKELIGFAESLFANGIIDPIEGKGSNYFIDKDSTKSDEIKEIELWAEKHYPKTFNMKEENGWNQGLLGYKQGKYNRINNILRHNPDFNGTQRCKDAKLTSDIYSIYTLTKEKQLPNDITVYRYTTWEDFKTTKEPVSKYKFLNWISPIKIGSICKEKGFCSTSMYKEYMKIFKKDFSYCNCLLKIHLPKGIHGIYYSFNEAMHPDKYLPEEYEFLLPPCTRFRIDKIDKRDKNNIFVECTALLN